MTGNFNIKWDYVIGIPRKYGYCQIVYGFYENGNAITDPKFVTPVQW